VTPVPHEQTIREAAPSDAEPLALLLGQLGYPVSAAALPARLARLAQSGNAVAVVATRGTAVLGLAVVQVYSYLHAEDELAWLTTIVVAEDARRQGVGRRLVAAAEQWARSRGSPRLSVNTGIHRSAAHAFYERMGYVYTGRRYAKPLD
jgi:GNAT superfamily N-acetyltransferase